MVYDSAHRKLTISGTVQGGAEHWSIGFRLIQPATQPTQAEVNSTEAPIRTWFTSVGMNLSIDSTVTEIKLAPIDVNGKYPVGLDSVVKVPSPGISGSTSGSPTWPQCSLAVSLTTPLPRGRGHIGRIYLPPFAASVVPVAGGISPGIADNILAATKTMLNTFAGLTGIGAVGVYSNVAAGTHQIVNGLRCGLVMDTQRRRRRSLPETYHTLAL